MYHGQVVIEGNLVKDPELAVIGEQQVELTKFTIAVNRYYKGADGKPNQEVLYIGVDAWGTLGKNCLLGSMDVNDDKVWNDYVAGLDKLQLPTVLKLMQTAYDRQYK
ncbi:MAG: single-stranded DNA-binding protein [Sphaerochaeta sp.]